MCPVDYASLGQCVPWTMCPLDGASLGRCDPCTMCPLKIPHDWLYLQSINSNKPIKTTFRVWCLYNLLVHGGGRLRVPTHRAAGTLWQGGGAHCRRQPGLCNTTGECDFSYERPKAGILCHKLRARTFNVYGAQELIPRNEFRQPM
jgi:hypothetical protein